ncbi:MAG: hypothetical protein AAF732_11325 [Pseudomonadota bacterium]
MVRKFDYARAAIAAVVASGLLSTVAVAQAITPAADERERLKACEAKICATALKKSGDGPLVCSIQKTWTKSYIENGVRQKKISWTFGDAQCGVDVNLSNGDIVSALTKPAHTVQFAEHKVACNVEREDSITKVNLTLSPKLEFENGKATKAWLNVSNIEAPTLIKGAIWTVAQLEDRFGLFHSDLISEVNEFLGSKCAKRYPDLAK